MNAPLFNKSIELASNAIERLQPDMLAYPTPCSEWNVRQLLNHMVYEIAWIPELLAGKTIAEVGSRFDGDLLGDGPVEAWERFASLALASVHRTEENKITHLSYGDIPAKRYVDEVGGDVIVHTWDLAKGLGFDVHIDDETAAAVMESARHILPMARKYRLIGKELKAVKSATPEEKLLAAYGRRPDWRP